MPIIALPQERIQQLKKRELPINNSFLSIDAAGELQTRSALLDQRIVEGYGVIWSSVNSYREQFVQGAYSKSIKEFGPESKSNYKIKYRNQHGRALALMAELKEDDIGLYFKTAPLDAIKEADEHLVQLRSGTVNNFSQGFTHVWDKIKWDDEKDIMINLEARLLEISGVDIPSDMETYAIRSHEQTEELNDNVERFIVENLPRNQQVEARILFARCMSLRDIKPHQQERNALKGKKPTKTGLDLKYILNNLKV